MIHTIPEQIFKWVGGMAGGAISAYAQPGGQSHAGLGAAAGAQFANMGNSMTSGIEKFNRNKNVGGQNKEKNGGDKNGGGQNKETEGGGARNAPRGGDKSVETPVVTQPTN